MVSEAEIRKNLDEVPGPTLGLSPEFGWHTTFRREDCGYRHTSWWSVGRQAFKRARVALPMPDPGRTRRSASGPLAFRKKKEGQPLS